MDDKEEREESDRDENVVSEEEMREKDGDENDSSEEVLESTQEAQGMTVLSFSPMNGRLMISC